ncbi:hypothetical protein FGG08_006274 [Glutinoglossum americanum]|uniref:SAGA-associated factor 11 n=1 Tax=Glutinoglossum americanum TaxID=1670608 RepID=A0A9P8HSZ2_9PEZI|nr:hypothetical protein FGG08_006274 [Glutinoglossum americanum]
MSAGTTDIAFDYPSFGISLVAEALAVEDLDCPLSNQTANTPVTMKPSTTEGDVLSLEEQLNLMAENIFEDIVENILHDYVLREHRDEKMVRARSAAILGKQAAEAVAAQEPPGHANSLTPNASLTGSPAPASGSAASGTTGNSKAVHTKSGYFEDGQFYLKGNPLETQQDIICERCGNQRKLSLSENPDPNKKYCKRQPFSNTPGLDIYGHPFLLEAGGSSRNGKDKDLATARTLADQASTPGSFESPATTPPDGTTSKTATEVPVKALKKTPLPLLSCRNCNRNMACNRLSLHLKSCLNLGGRRRGGRDASQGVSQNAYTTPCGSKTGTPMPEPRKNAAKSPGKRDRDDDDSEDEPKKKKIKKPPPNKLAQKNTPVEKKKTKAQLAAEAKSAKTAAAKAAKDSKEVKLAKGGEGKDTTSSAVKVVGDKANGETVNKRKRKAETLPNANGASRDIDDDEKDSITLSQTSSSTLASSAPQSKKQKMAPNEKPAKNPVSNFKVRHGSPENGPAGGRISNSPIPLPKSSSLGTPATSTTSQSSSASGIRPGSSSKPLNSNTSSKSKAIKKENPRPASNISPKPKTADPTTGPRSGKTLPKPPPSPMKPKPVAAARDLAVSADNTPLTSPTLKKRPANGSPLKKNLKDKETETNPKEKKDKAGPKISVKRAAEETPAAKKTVPKKPRAGNADEGNET